MISMRNEKQPPMNVIQGHRNRRGEDKKTVFSSAKLFNNYSMSARWI